MSDVLKSINSVNWNQALLDKVVMKQILPPSRKGEVEVLRRKEPVY